MELRYWVKKEGVLAGAKIKCYYIVIDRLTRVALLVIWSFRWGPALGQQATIYVYHLKDQQVATGTTATATVAAAAPGAAVVAAAAGAVFADGGGV